MPATTNVSAKPTAMPDFSSVHASAGSGKTFHLVSHIIRLLIHGATPGSILAITFTRKAAAEMQQRLFERVSMLATCSKPELVHTLTEQLGLEASATHCDSARSLYEDLLHSPQHVRTTTFHAFCQDLLRRFPMEANLPPGFELIERTGYLIDDAWNSLTNKLTRPDDPRYPNDVIEVTKSHMEVLLRHFGTDKTKSVLSKFIAARSEWWALSNQPGFELSDYLAELAQQLNTDLGQSVESLIQAYFQDATSRQQLAEFIELLNKHPIKSNQQAVQAIEQALRLSEQTSEALPALKLIWSVFFTTTDQPRARTINKTITAKLGEQGCDDYLNIHQTQCDRLIQLRQAMHASETLTLTAAWIGAGQAYIDEYQAIKRFHRSLDFSDLEWQCYCLLNSSDHADWVQYKLDQRIEHLLIDEFQDTNPTQWQLVLPLLSEIAASEQERFRSVLFVGDAKQSIYRFRRAEPKLFGTASDWLENNLNAQKQYLNQSYRSSPAIIDFVNQFFIDNPDALLPDFQAHLTHKKTLAGSVTILPIITPPELESEPESKSEPKLDQATAAELRNPLHTPRPDVLTFHYYEAQAVANTIKDLIKNKTIIASGEQSHYLTHADILILLRNRTHAIDYERALREAHIPYLGTERGTLLDSLEIKDMVNLLQWLITPFDNHALAGVLRSPLFSASNEDLYPLAGQTHWFEYMTDHLDDYSSDHPLHRAVTLLSRWIMLTDTLPVHDLLDRIYSEANVLARYQANYPKHLQARALSNLTRFIELALENDSGRYPSLTRFLAWLKLLKQQDKEAPDQPANDAEQNRVRILTIHESKGLEAPIVFLVDSTTTKHNSGGENVIVDWPSEAPQPSLMLLSPSSRYPTPLCQQAIEQQQAKDAQEDINLLYVAVTRAKQHLYISGNKKPAGWYQQICKQFDIDANELLKAPQISREITQCSGDTTSPTTTESIATTSKEIDIRLQQPVKLESDFIEIAPSHTDINEYEPLAQLGRDSSLTTMSKTEAIERGNQIHDMLLCLANRPGLTFDDYLHAHSPNGRNDNTDLDQQDHWRQAEQTIQHFPEYFNEEKYQQAFSEIPIYFKRQDKQVHGIIDRLVITQHEAIIIDYKTHQFDIPTGADLSSEPVRQQLKSLAAQYRSQMDLYREGVQQLYPALAVRTRLILTSLPTYLEID